MQHQSRASWAEVHPREVFDLPSWDGEMAEATEAAPADILLGAESGV